MKNFKKNGGFTLVDLIVVIAILAILAAVAVPAYSGYVTKANKQTDTTMANDVGQALLMAYYAGEIVTEDAVYVVIGPDGIVKASDDATKGIVDAAFANGSLKLNYDGWDAAVSTHEYQKSSYKGQEKATTKEVQKLVGALSGFMKDETNAQTGKNLITYMEGQGWDTTNDAAVGNAAVLYVAQQSAANKDKITSSFNSALDPDTGVFDVNTMFNSMQSTVGSAASIAAIYSLYEGYALATNQGEKLHSQTGTVFDPSKLSDVQSVFNAINGIDMDMDGFDAYVKEKGATDLNAYLELMENTNLNQGIVAGDIKNTEIFTSDKMLNALNEMSNVTVGVEAGQIAVALVIDNGVPTIEYTMKDIH